jgi:hypothetical protein
MTILVTGSTGTIDAAPSWHDTGATPLPADATVRVALSRS